MKVVAQRGSGRKVRQAGVFVETGLTECVQRGFVVRLLSNLRDLLGVHDVVVFIEYEDCAGTKSCQRTIGDFQSVYLSKIAAERGESHSAFNAFCTTKTLESKGEIC
jgi:hypothetical protein